MALRKHLLFSYSPILLFSYSPILLSLVIAFLSSAVALEPTQSESEKVIRIVVEDLAKPITVNLGEMPIDSQVKFDFRVENKTGRKVDLVFKPSCSCLKLTSSHLEIDNLSNRSLLSELRTPANAEKIRVQIDCWETTSNSFFSIQIAAEAIERVSISPAIIDISSGTEQTLSLATTLPGLTILSIRSLSEHFDASLVDSPGHPRATAKLRLMDQKAILADGYITLLVATSGDRTTLVKLPYEHSGVVRLLPSVVQLSKEKQHAQGVLLLRGSMVSEKQKNTSIQLYRDGFDPLPCEVIEFRKRSVGVVVVKFSFPLDSIVESEISEWKLCAKGVSDKQIDWNTSAKCRMR